MSKITIVSLPLLAMLATASITATILSPTPPAAYAQQLFGGIGSECTGGGFAEAQCKSDKIERIANATIKNMTSDQEIQSLKAQDPEFAAFTNIVSGCLTGQGGPSLTIGQCNMSMTEATGKWCGLEGYNEQKCMIASSIAQNVTDANLLAMDVGSFLGSLE
jgi:hypothetical protein